MGLKKALMILYFLLFLHFLTVRSRPLHAASGGPNLPAPAEIDGDGFAGKTREITAVVRRGGGARGGGGGGRGRGFGGRGGRGGVIPVYAAGSHRRGHSSTGQSLKPGSGSVGFLGLSVWAGLMFMF
ncbi:PREDICTED: cold shock domain-containing protein 4-like [Tarenaya hassleriana]|uniref:cold shock domain-containing protein 4-like n=1 Tax=Tarenaya hassleriana TaxID=28532 RepID=UPI00053C3C25|nr:PREDICTED: cold shock domain-containing protein 4-like [Tarenaya hassleriana]